MPNLAVRGLCNEYQGSGRRYPEHPLVRSVLNVSSHVGEAEKATSPQGHRPGQPRPQCRSLRLFHGWMQGGDGAFGLEVHPPQPGRTRGCPGLYLRSAGTGGQSSRGSSSTAPGRSAVTSRPRLRLQPVSNYSRSRAPCHHTTPQHAGPVLPCLPGCSGASPGTSRLRQHLSPRPLPYLQFCITAHPLSNTCEQVRKPGHSSYHSCRDAGSIGISWSFQQRDNGTIPRGTVGSFLAPPSTHHPLTWLISTLSSSCLQNEDGDPAHEQYVAIPACQLLPAPHQGGVIEGDSRSRCWKHRPAGHDAGVHPGLCWLAALEPGHSPVPSPQSQSQTQELSWGKTALR